jgi:hypothetical protein
MGVRFAYVTGIERMSISRRASSGLGYGERPVLACWNKSGMKRKTGQEGFGFRGDGALYCTLGDGGSPGGPGLRGLAALLAAARNSVLGATRPAHGTHSFGMPAAYQVRFSDGPPITESGRPGLRRTGKVREGT